MNYRFTLSLILLLSMFLAAPALAELIDKAVSDNPEVKASEARWRMFKSKVAQAR